MFLNQGKNSRSSYYGYIFIYEDDLSIILKEDLQMRINKAKDSFDSKYGTYLVIKVIEGQEVYKIYDTLNELAVVENIPKGETTRKHVNSNKEYKGMWIFRLSPRKYSEKEQSSFMQKNINLVDLLAIISSLKESTEESI